MRMSALQAVMVESDSIQIWECLTCGKQLPKGTRCPDCDPETPTFDPKSPPTFMQAAAVILCVVAAWSLFAAWLRWQYNIDLWHIPH